MDKRGEILDAAERRARLGGYNGFSFREIASDVGIKSASVHYHFPTKADLGEALAERYIERAMEALGNPAGLEADIALDRVAGLFFYSSEVDDLMCLCGVFGAEIGALPPSINASVARYFEAMTNWLAGALDGEDQHGRAQFVVASLEGALIMSRVKSEPEILRGVVNQLHKHAL